MNAAYRRSVEIIKGAQAPSGALVACPNFSTYRYCWYRDGAFIAHALDLAGAAEAALRFHDWAARTVLAHRDDARAAIWAAERGERPSRYLLARYTLEGQRDEGEWPNFQLDGLGTWLWALAARPERLSGARLEAGRLAAEYLAALWPLPCYDLWEEHGERRHPSTLAAIYGGLQALAPWLPAAGAAAREVRREVLKRAVEEGRFAKFLDGDGLDASLLGLAVPYGLVAADDPPMVATVGAIEGGLRGPRGGLRRYAGDAYYGGGEWILLTAWLGWYHAVTGAVERARAAVEWVEAQADPVSGELPEQVGGEDLAPEMHARWAQRWGPVANPLIWSHAMHVILVHALA